MHTAKTEVLSPPKHDRPDVIVEAKEPHAVERHVLGDQPLESKRRPTEQQEQPPLDENVTLQVLNAIVQQLDKLSSTFAEQLSPKQQPQLVNKLAQTDIRDGHLEDVPLLVEAQDRLIRWKSGQSAATPISSTPRTPLTPRALFTSPTPPAPSTPRVLFTPRTATTMTPKKEMPAQRIDQIPPVPDVPVVATANAHSSLPALHPPSEPFWTPQKDPRHGVTTVVQTQQPSKAATISPEREHPVAKQKIVPTLPQKSTLQPAEKRVTLTKPRSAPAQPKRSIVAPDTAAKVLPFQELPLKRTQLVKMPPQPPASPLHKRVSSLKPPSPLTKTPDVIQTKTEPPKPSNNAHYLSKDNATWIPCFLDTQSPVLDITSYEDEKKLPLSEPSTVPLRWISAVDTSEPDQVRVELEDQEDPIVLKFSDPRIQNAFVESATRAISATDAVEGDAVGVQPVYDPNTDPSKLLIKNENGDVVGDVPVSSPEEAAAISGAIEALTKGPPLKRLPSFAIDVVEKTDDLMQYIKTVTPEALAIVVGAWVTVCPYGAYRPETKFSKVVSADSVRAQVLVNNGVGLKVEQQPISAKIQELHNFDPSTKLIDLASLVRAVPIDIRSFLLTLKFDEARRLTVTEFDTLLQRWAFGDLIDSIAQYSYMSSVAASITVREREAAERLQTYLNKTQDTKPGRKAIKLRVGDAKQKTVWSPVQIQDKCFLWDDGSTGKAAFDHSTSHITSYKRETATTVEITVEGHRSPFIFKIPKPRLQRLFGDYIKTLMVRQQLAQNLDRATSSAQVAIQTGTKRSVELIEELVSSASEDCIILARLNIQISLPSVNGDIKFIPAHFNMICTRIVTDNGMVQPPVSIDLAQLAGITGESNMTQRIRLLLDGTTTTQKEQDYQIRFTRLTEMYAFYSLCCRILSYYGRTNVFPFKELEGRSVTKAGARVAPTRAERRSKAGQRAFTPSPHASHSTESSPLHSTPRSTSETPPKIRASTERRSPTRRGWIPGVFRGPHSEAEKTDRRRSPTTLKPVPSAASPSKPQGDSTSIDPEFV